METINPRQFQFVQPQGVVNPTAQILASVAQGLLDGQKQKKADEAAAFDRLMREKVDARAEGAVERQGRQDKAKAFADLQDRIRKRELDKRADRDDAAAQDQIADSREREGSNREQIAHFLVETQPDLSPDEAVAAATELADSGHTVMSVRQALEDRDRDSANDAALRTQRTRPRAVSGGATNTPEFQLAVQHADQIIDGSIARGISDPAEWRAAYIDFIEASGGQPNMKAINDRISRRLLDAGREDNLENVGDGNELGT